MKKQTFVAVLISSVLLFACKKEDLAEQQQQQPSQQNEFQQKSANLPHYNETNTKGMTWDQLPAELKNAQHISKAPNEGARLSEANYSTYVFASRTWGGTGGGSYSIYPSNGSSIYAIGISSGAFIDRIIVWYRNSSGNYYYGGTAGGTGGTYHLYYFGTSEYIQYVYGKAAAYVDHLAFITNYKVFSGGGGGGTPFFYTVPASRQILGFYGGSGAFLDRIGFYIYTF